MPEFLVTIDVRRPADTVGDVWGTLVQAESRVGSEYRRRGVIKRIWRVPGTTANVGIWEAADATELHHLLSELPLFGYMTIEVAALARHYLELADDHA